ncbi:hypothetical protein ACOMHN_021618 [Nucella lapillus]
MASPLHTHTSLADFTVIVSGRPSEQTREMAVPELSNSIHISSETYTTFTCTTTTATTATFSTDYDAEPTPAL